MAGGRRQVAGGSAIVSVSERGTETKRRYVRNKMSNVCPDWRGARQNTHEPVQLFRHVRFQLLRGLLLFLCAQEARGTLAALVFAVVQEVDAVIRRLTLGLLLQLRRDRGQRLPRAKATRPANPIRRKRLDVQMEDAVERMAGEMQWDTRVCERAHVSV